MSDRTHEISHDSSVEQQRQQKDKQRYRAFINDAVNDNNNDNNKQQQIAGAGVVVENSSMVGGNINRVNSDDQDSHDYMEDLDGEHDRFRKYLDHFNKFRYVIGGIVNNKQVQLFIVVLISINALMMGIGTFDFVTQNPKVEQAFDDTDKAFLIIFSIEMGMQLIYHGWRLFLDGWLVFDLLIIILSWSFSSVQIIRAFRIFRALRLVTRIKVMKNLMLALFGVMPRMMAIGLLLLLVLYIFAVMFTQLFGDLKERDITSENYFGDMGETLFTLFQIMTMDAWATIAREVMTEYPWAWLPFIAYVIITGFIVVNLIIAVICDAISALHDDDKAKLLGMYDETRDDNTDNDESEGSPSSQMDTQEQMENLEQQIEELSQIQEQTLQTLEHLTLKLQMRKMKQIDSSDSASEDSN